MKCIKKIDLNDITLLLYHLLDIPIQYIKMDFTQNKLTRSEWENIEIPVSESEKKIVKMIIQGFNDVNIRFNESESLFSHIKIEKTPEIDYFLYKKYFHEDITNMIKKYDKNTPLSTFKSQSNFGELRTLKSADSIRLQNLDNRIKTNKNDIFEFLLIDLCKELIKNISKKKQKYAFYLYTLIQLKKTSIHNLNENVILFVNFVIEYGNSITKINEIITNAYNFIEKNTYLLKYEDKTLFNHQKELFTICNNPEPKLILYTAPTGTGKTLSPLGLSEKYRIIFVCVARHIGLALAKSAISVEKKVAFAFGCETASDIRLHYFSAINFTKNRKSGGIWKVDNSIGDNVEIMICDVQSYLTAMHYMLAFNPVENIITYWDEPTITLDYEQHPLHNIIQRNWVENKISKMVLSCATLPSENEIYPIFDDFRNKFDGAEIHTIKSFDCRKSIPILNKEGYCVLPHYLYEEYIDLINCVEYCLENKTMLRYFDLREIVQFIDYIHDENKIEETYSIDLYFNKNISEITMNKLKEYYLDLLLHIKDGNECWKNIYDYVMKIRKERYSDEKIVKTHSIEYYNSRDNCNNNLKRTYSVQENNREKKMAISSKGILLTTKDAYTLTDGPTIFLVDDVNKIGNFYIQQTNIPDSIFQNIMVKIIKNSEIIQKIEELESMIEVKETKSNSSGDDTRMAARESGRICNESQKWMDEINKLRKNIKLVSLDAMYVPNTCPHQQIWGPGGEINERSFVSNIGEDIAKTIMELNIDNHYKILLLLGIGMFNEIKCVEYCEIMKKLAEEQRLFMIIASTDYVYGTNYQFCHGIIGKDLTRMTQQKTLQAMGRIGRNNVQQDYTIRFRDNDIIMKLFSKQEENLEAINMCKLFQG
jgi:hypothetical protein